MSSLHKHLSILLVNAAKQLAKETARAARRSKKRQIESDKQPNSVADKQSNPVSKEYAYKNSLGKI